MSQQPALRSQVLLPSELVVVLKDKKGHLPAEMLSSYSNQEKKAFLFLGDF